MSRWKASGIHFLISLLIAALVVTAVILVMYPSPYTRSAGASKLLVTLIGVDVTLGPLITLIIFKHGKPGLKFDLSVIAALQIAALAYGLYMIGQARPVYATFVKDRFVLVPANAISDAALAKAQAPFTRKSWTGPMLVGTSSAGTDSIDVLMSSLSGGATVDALPEFYIPFAEQKEMVLERSKSITVLAARSGEVGQRATEWLKKHEADNYVYYPLQLSSGLFHTIILDKTSAEPVAVIPVDPW